MYSCLIRQLLHIYAKIKYTVNDSYSVRQFYSVVYMNMAVLLFVCVCACARRGAWYRASVPGEGLGAESPCGAAGFGAMASSQLLGAAAVLPQ